MCICVCLQCICVCVCVCVCVCICAVLNHEARQKRLCSEHLIWFRCLRLAAGGLKQRLQLCVSVWLWKKQIETDLSTCWHNSSTHSQTTLLQMLVCFYCCFLTRRKPRSHLLLAPCLHDDTQQEKLLTVSVNPCQALAAVLIWIPAWSGPAVLFLTRAVLKINSVPFSQQTRLEEIDGCFPCGSLCFRDPHVVS